MEVTVFNRTYYMAGFVFRSECWEDEVILKYVKLERYFRDLHHRGYEDIYRSVSLPGSSCVTSFDTYIRLIQRNSRYLKVGVPEEWYWNFNAEMAERRDTGLYYTYFGTNENKLRDTRQLYIFTLYHWVSLMDAAKARDFIAEYQDAVRLDKIDYIVDKDTTENTCE
jgi:hypothetical protein